VVWFKSRIWSYGYGGLWFLRKNVPVVVLMLAVVLFGGVALAPVDAAIIQFNEYQITSNTSSQVNPDIHGTNIVYQDNSAGNWDIYLYVLQGAWVPESRITTNTANQVQPAIWRDLIVYMDDRNGNWDIYMYNITSQIETQITTDPADQVDPAINGNRVVWQDNRDGSLDIYMFDLTTHTESCLVPWLSNYYPAISGDKVVYTRVNSNNGYAIYC
jgi:beta propeller repeat protein